MLNVKKISAWLWRVARICVPLSLFLYIPAHWAANHFWQTQGGLTLSEPLNDWLKKLIPILSPELAVFDASVLLAELPCILAIITSLLIVGWFIQSLYGLQNPGEGIEFALRLVFGIPAFKPYLRYSKGGSEVMETGVEDEDETGVLRKAGGPGNLLLYADTAVVTEQKGRLARVIRGPALERLGNFEKVYAVIDLQSQQWQYAVNAMSKEGIPITCKTDISFQIDDSNGPAEQETAIFKAATSTWAREKERVEDKMNWAGRVIISNTEGTLRTLLAQMPLDQLVPSQIISPDKITKTIDPAKHRREIQEKLRAALEASAPTLGVKITSVFLGHIEVDEDIAQQWADIWQTGWRKWATETIGTAKAERIQILEEARANTWLDLLEQAAEAIKRSSQAGYAISNEVIALHFLEALVQTQGPAENLIKTYLVPDSWETLERFRRTL